VKPYPYRPPKIVGRVDDWPWCHFWVGDEEYVGEMKRSLWPADVEPLPGLVFTIPARRDGPKVNFPLGRPVSHRRRKRMKRITRLDQWVLPAEESAPTEG
jgi:hypothetical protein